MKNFGPGLLRTWLAIISLTAAHARADDRRAANLIIHASGFAHERGQAIASLFYEGDDVFKKPRARVMSAIQEGKAILVFPELMPGHYAVLVFHDENGNGDLDHNTLRLPAEPLGYSNGFELNLFSGLPSFGKLRFAFEGNGIPLSIRVK